MKIAIVPCIDENRSLLAEFTQRVRWFRVYAP